MTVTPATLSFLTELLVLATTIGVMVNRFNKLEHKVDINRYHLESHCRILTHLSSHVAQTSDYQPITKSTLP